MSLLVTGSIGIDTVETPLGRATDVLGGSAVYFSLAASLFSPVRLVGVVGEDFDPRALDDLRRRPIDLTGIETRRGSRTFRWHGRYAGAMNEAQTVDVKLNVLAERGPAIPPAFADSRFVFLANTHPALQGELADRFAGADLIVCDTMNLWINTQPDELRRTLAKVHGLVLNEGEARLLTARDNLIEAGREIIKLGPRFVAIKKGEHGSLLVTREHTRLVPAYPTASAVDPTGCGDSFAGGMMGYVAARQRSDIDTLHAGMARGSVVASFVIEAFSVNGLSKLSLADVEARLSELATITRWR